MKKKGQERKPRGGGGKERKGKVSVKKGKRQKIEEGERRGSGKGGKETERKKGEKAVIERRKRKERGRKTQKERREGEDFINKETINKFEVLFIDEAQDLSLLQFVKILQTRLV